MASATGLLQILPVQTTRMRLNMRIHPGWVGAASPPFARRSRPPTIHRPTLVGTAIAQDLRSYIGGGFAAIRPAEPASHRTPPHSPVSAGGSGIAQNLRTYRTPTTYPIPALSPTPYRASALALAGCGRARSSRLLQRAMIGAS